VRCDVRLGHVASEILAAAWKYGVELMAISSRGQMRAELLPLGSMAQKIVKYAASSVWLMR